MIASNTGDVCYQTTCSRRHSQTGHLRNHFNRLTHDCRIERTLLSRNNFSELIRFSGRKKMRALKFELFAHGLLDRRIANHRLL